MSTTTAAALPSADNESAPCADKQPPIVSESNEEFGVIEAPTTTATRLSAEYANVDDDIIRAPNPAKPAKSTAAASRLLRRAFSMPRNPFRLSSRKLLKVNDGGRTASSSLDEHEPPSNENGVERYSSGSSASSSNGSYTRTEEAGVQLLNACRNGMEHTSDSADQQQSAGDASENNKSQSNALKRRSQSWRKVILRLAHQMTTIGVSVCILVQVDD